MGDNLAQHVDEALAIARADESSLLAIVGPTASGKTDLAIAIAERVGGEIVSVDSVQIYRGFDIGSGKPTKDELARAPHRMIDIVDPLDAMDAARFASLAELEIKAIRDRGKIPIVCGGTFLWVKALVFGLVDAPAANAEVRARHRAIVDARGRPALHEELARVDPATATRLHPNDFVRVSRALEVFELTGRSMGEWHAEHAFKSRRHAAHMIARALSPEELTARIGARVDRWLASGWIDETRALLERGFRASRAMSSVGYREVRAHIDGDIAREELAIAIVRATRIFARRQRTWLRQADVRWLTT